MEATFIKFNSSVTEKIAKSSPKSRNFGPSNFSGTLQNNQVDLIDALIVAMARQKCARHFELSQKLQKNRFKTQAVKFLLFCTIFITNYRSKIIQTIGCVF